MHVSTHALILLRSTGVLMICMAVRNAENKVNGDMIVLNTPERPLSTQLKH